MRKVLERIPKRNKTEAKSNPRKSSPTKKGKKGKGKVIKPVEIVKGIDIETQTEPIPVLQLLVKFYYVK
jgi:hypothetical protein